MKNLMASLLLLMAACSGGSTEEPRRPQQAGQPLDGVEIAGRMVATRAAAMIGDQQAVQAQVSAMHEDFRKAIKLADGTRPVDREAARMAAKTVPGVRSVVWLDASNLFAIVERNELRSQPTIDAICLQLEPLGDTLGVVVNLQSGAARSGDELEILSRNCQLAPGDRAMLQAHRKVDAIDPAVRAQHKANAAWAEAQQMRTKEAAQSAKILEASTPEM